MINFVQGSLLCPLTFDISNFWSRRLASAIHGVVSGFCSCSEFQYFSSVLSPSVLVLARFCGCPEVLMFNFCLYFLSILAGFAVVEQFNVLGLTPLAK